METYEPDPASWRLVPPEHVGHEGPPEDRSTWLDRLLNLFLRPQPGSVRARRLMGLSDRPEALDERLSHDGPEEGLP